MRQHFRQLAFEWGEAGEAQPSPGEGSPPPAAPDQTEALVQDLMEEVVVAENLRRAYKRVRANGGGPGVDGMTTEELSTYLKGDWPRLKQELLEGRYRPQPVRRVEIPKPDGGKRQLGIPTVVDRFIQQAVLQVLTPRIDPDFSSSSYGYRPGKSAHQALAQARQQVESGRSWVVDIDLEKFFDRVNHDLLMGRLAKRIGDKRLLRLLRRYLEAGVLINGVVVERHEGTPQGGPLSPLLANILLDELDQELERRGHRFCRYADDCNIYVRSQRAGERVLASVARFLETKLRLKVNWAKSAVGQPWERTFLGYRIRRQPDDQQDVRLHVAPESLKRAKDRIRQLTRRNRGVSLDQVLNDLRAFTDGWVGYYWRTGYSTLFRSLDGWIRRRLRCYQWKLWKTAQNRRRQLLRAGVWPRWARAVCYGLGAWRVALSPPMARALSNARLAQLGYASLHDRYQALASA